MSTAPHWWLVGKTPSGTDLSKFPSGAPAQIVQAAAKPTGFDWIVDLGNDKTKLAQNIANAAPGAPTKISIPSTFKNVPGIGDITVKGPSGVAGLADKAVTTAGNLTNASIGALFGSASLWAGVGLTLLGAALILFGIMKLSGADPKQAAKRMVR